MKNMKIGAKILLGFGIVLALTVILAVVVISTNVSSINNIEDTSAVSDYQTMVNTMLDTYNNARISASILYLTVNTEEYNNLVNNYDQLGDLLSKMDDMSAKHKILAKYTAETQKINDELKLWRVNIDNLQADNELFDKLSTEMRSSGMVLSSDAGNAFDVQSEGLKNAISKNQDSATVSRYIKMMEIAESVESGIIDVRRNAAQFVDTYDPSRVGSLFDNVVAVKGLMNDYIGTTVSADSKAAMDNLLLNFTTYTDLLKEYENALIISADHISGSKETADITTTLMFDLSYEMDDLMAGNMNTTISSASTTLVIIIIISIFAILFGLLIAVIIMRGITQPVQVMYGVINKVGTTGSFEFSEAELSKLKSAISKDEIGQSIGAFNQMINKLIKIAHDLETVASGDLTVDIEVISHEDTIGNALTKMLDNLNMMFREINVAAEQVNSGADQVSSASQALSQGATEQASSIEELSASIQEVSGQISINSDNATKATDIANETKTEVENGNAQMQQMLQAMNEINTSSNEISKIIKVIDDIAFQTNILALNAAVEAARAGAAGKGFAVVADEVRNLASKSADAAKQTTALIEGSVSSVGSGAEIAHKTAQSLEAVSAKTEEVSALIKEIAKASQEQSVAVNQINIGVEQISSVVQNNSATAEESAAAAEELSGQSNMLNEQIAHFKLKY